MPDYISPPPPTDEAFKAIAEINSLPLEVRAGAAWIKAEHLLWDRVRPVVEMADEVCAALDGDPMVPPDVEFIERLRSALANLYPETE